MSEQANNTFPLAPARLVHQKTGPVWAVQVCPLCGGEHVHQAAGADPRAMLWKPIPRPCHPSNVTPDQAAFYIPIEADQNTLRALAALRTIRIPWAIYSPQGNLIGQYLTRAEAVNGSAASAAKGDRIQVCNLRVLLLGMIIRPALARRPRTMVMQIRKRAKASWEGG